MIRATGAKLRMLASEARLLFPFFEDCGVEADGWDDGDDMAPAAGRPFCQVQSNN
jgi:hypothetical protein